MSQRAVLPFHYLRSLETATDEIVFTQGIPSCLIKSDLNNPAPLANGIPVSAIRATSHRFSSSAFYNTPLLDVLRLYRQPFLYPNRAVKIDV
jgi:hypothetical protein